MPKKSPKNDTRAYPPALMNPEDAARYLSVSESFLRELVAEGKLHAVSHRLNGHPKYRRSDLDQYVEGMSYAIG